MMLPKRVEVETRITTTVPITSGIFNHPVVILSKEIYHGKVAVCVVTSFDDTPIENRHPDPARRQSYLPIRPARHPDTRCDLIAAHGKMMKKRSYVNIKDVHEIPFVALRSCWRDNDLHLETISYQILTSELWKQNLGGLATRLKGHGIFERTAQSTCSEAPVPVRIAHPGQGLTQDLGRGTNFARISSSPLSTSYGTFIQNSTASVPQSYATVHNSANAARDYHYPRIHQFQPPVLARHGDASSQQIYVTAEQRRYGEVDTEPDWPDWLGVLALICFLAAVWYWLADPTVN
ncbi:uncharacterized protein FPRO_14601 [Fusarium proliferatum ET1]|uniref:Uncharacterized protein n=1 Tax=Fusarium proliferatum (strain ET1) TaxID=1227346 RepID=A0A1L7VWP0_FUSPR|nr:uncharacterized protein FPRO_14601 [Fusarium proliferatum ET1]CZR44849.1 uncharacterized protein FPRO_14601 [Fusarium proliferatum ET1]